MCNVTTSPSKRPTERFRAESLGKRLKGGELDRLRGAMDLPWWTVHYGGRVAGDGAVYGDRWNTMSSCVKY